MKVLVLGTNGFLGLKLFQKLKRNNQIYNSGNKYTTELFGLSVKFNDSSLLEIRKMLTVHKFEWIINCIALTDLDYCEKNPKLAFWVNAELPKLISQLCSDFDVKLFHFSTDAVFDGTLNLPDELDKPTPLSVYGATKLIGEQNILKVQCECIIARVNFFGYSHNKMSIFNFFYEALRRNDIVFGYTDIKFTPLYIGDLIEIVTTLLVKNINGLFHIVGSDLVSKYDFGIMVAKYFGFSTHIIKPSLSIIDSNLNYRSKNLGLSNNKIKEIGVKIPALNDGFLKLKKDMEKANEIKD